MTQEQKANIENYKALSAKLISEGFVRICSTMAGENSKSIWHDPKTKGRKASLVISSGKWEITYQ